MRSEVQVLCPRHRERLIFFLPIKEEVERFFEPNFYHSFKNIQVRTNRKYKVTLFYNYIFITICQILHLAKPYTICFNTLYTSGVIVENGSMNYPATDQSTGRNGAKSDQEGRCVIVRRTIFTSHCLRGFFL